VRQKKVKIAKYGRMELVFTEQFGQEQAVHLPVVCVKKCCVFRNMSESLKKVWL
jgi:hypothetical protein